MLFTDDATAYFLQLMMGTNAVRECVLAAQLTQATLPLQQLQHVARRRCQLLRQPARRRCVQGRAPARVGARVRAITTFMCADCDLGPERLLSHGAAQSPVAASLKRVC